MREIGGRDQIRRSRSEALAGTHTEEIQPVSKMGIAVPDLVRAGARLLVIHPAAHADVLILEDPPIAVRQIEFPWNNRGGIAPPGRAPDWAIAAAEYVRHDEWNTSVLELIRSEILQPLAEETVDVHV